MMVTGMGGGVASQPGITITTGMTGMIMEGGTGAIGMIIGTGSGSYLLMTPAFNSGL